MDARFDEKVMEAVNFSVTRVQTMGSISVTFGKEKPEAIENKIIIILQNLASLKDHLKNCLKKNGLNPNLVETEINNSQHLQILIDLVNQEKHGYPLTKTNRSGKNPLIKDAHQVLIISTGKAPGSSASVSFDSEGSVEIQGDNHIAIVADVVDDHGTFLLSLDELIETSYSKFKAIATTYHCF